MKHRHDKTLDFVVGVFVCISLLGYPAQAQETANVATTHPWARFGLGSWKRVRIYNESISDQGQVEQTSATDTKTTLLEVSNTGYTLQVEVTVEVAGKSFPADPKIIRQGFHGETNGQLVNVETVGAGEVVIEGKTYAIEKLKVIINGDDQKRTTLVHYSDQVSPYVLKRETTATDVANGKPKYESIVDVVAVAMPFRVLTQTKLVSLVKTTQTQVSGASSVTLEMHCDDVPGGVVAHSAKELDAHGHVVSRSALELLEYQVNGSIAAAENGKAGRRRVFQRARSR